MGDRAAAQRGVGWERKVPNAHLGGAAADVIVNAQMQSSGERREGPGRGAGDTSTEGAVDGTATTDVAWAVCTEPREGKGWNRVSPARTREPP